MKDNFDLRKYLVENKATIQSKQLNESDTNPENKDLAQQTGQKPLTKGDIITPDMWKNKNSEALTYWFNELGAKSPTDVLIKDIRCWDTTGEDCTVRLVLKNQPLSLKNLTRKSYHSRFTSPTYEAGWFDGNEWKYLTQIYQELKPEYKIVLMDK